MEKSIDELWENAIGLLQQARTDPATAQILIDGDPQEVEDLLQQAGLDSEDLQRLNEDLEHIQTDNDLALRFWFFIVKPFAPQSILPPEPPWGPPGGQGN